MGVLDYYTYNYFAEVPTDRLITGFLTVNIRHKDGDEAANNDWKYEQRKSPTNFSPNNSNPIVDPLGQHIGDYHCFLYYLVVAAHWHTHRTPAWTADFSAGVPDHPHCQSFIRAHPVALMNPDNGTLMNHKAITVGGQDGVIVSKLGNPKNGGSIDSDDADLAGNQSFASTWTWPDISSQFGIHNGLGSPYKQPTGTLIDDELNHQFTAPAYGAGGDVSGMMGNPWSGFPDLAFNRMVNTSADAGDDYYYPRGNNTGLMPNYGNGYIDSSVTIPASNSDPQSGTSGGVAEDQASHINSVLKSPVRSILIEGWHDFKWRSVGSAFQIQRHTPYSIRVQIKLNNDNTDGTTPNPGTPADTALGTRSTRCNVMFQPFGETNVIKFNTTPPSSLSTDGNPE